MANLNKTTSTRFIGFTKKGRRLPKISRKELRYGDLLGIFTQNSIYAIAVLEDSNFLVSGGYFDRHNLSPQKITINGCTRSGIVINRDIIAAEGFCIEFGNGLVTSPIKKFHVLKFDLNETHN